MSMISKDKIYQEALERMMILLTEIYPEQADEFQHTLRFVIQDIVSYHDPIKAWSYSKLNTDGAPVEFTFSSLDDEIRYTVEIAGPDVLSKDRLTHLVQLLSDLNPELSLEERVTRFKEIQEDATLRWGAWLGIRHQKTRTSYKIYAEIPNKNCSKVDDLIAEYLVSMPTLPNNRQAKLVALGQTPGDIRCEFYFVLSGLGLQQEDVIHLLRPFGLENNVPKLFELMKEVRQMIFEIDKESPLPNIEYAFSYSILPQSKHPIFSIFTMADKYIGSDALVRYAVMMTAVRHHWSFENYAKLTEPIARQIKHCTCHNIIAFILMPDGQCGLHISLSPPFF